MTGSRAEFGILRWLIQEIHDDPDLELVLIVTGSHLSERHGLTVSEIAATGLPIAAEVPLDLAADEPVAVAKAMAQCLTGMATIFASVRPDMVFVLGDRYEIFAAAQAAMLQRLPIAHIAGGDVTEGAIDDVMRHAITKLAHLHFATNSSAGDRIRQMGEDPDRVYIVGSPALDHLRRVPLMNRPEIEAALGKPLGTRNILVTFHPVTLASDFGQSELSAMLKVLEEMEEDARIWITGSNADSGGQQIRGRIEEWSRSRDNVALYTSLGVHCYMSLMRECDLVIGNSSSGLYEAPSLGIPTVDIGVRQAGRLAANSVFRCDATPEAIWRAIKDAQAFDRSTARSPYGDGHSAKRIVSVLKTCDLGESLVRKTFHLIPGKLQ